MMLVHTFKHYLIRFHNNTIQFIRFRFIMQNINIIYMHYNNYQQYIHIIMDHILMLYLMYLYINQHIYINY